MNSRNLVSEVYSRIKEWYVNQVGIPHSKGIKFISNSNNPRLERMIEEAGVDHEKLLHMIRETNEYKSATDGYNRFQKLEFEAGILGKARRDIYRKHY